MIKVSLEWPHTYSLLNAYLFFCFVCHQLSGRQARSSLEKRGTVNSGRKNVLRKLLRIPYRRLKAGFSVCWLCLFVAGVLSEMHEVRTFAPCKAFLFEMFAFFRRLKITLDSEQPMLKEKRIIPSVWGGINVFNFFKEASIFLIIVHSSCELILCPVLLNSPSVRLD